MKPVHVYSDFGCPFAHRVLAILTELGLEFEHHESEIGVHPKGLELHSPSGRLPILVHGDLVLGESVVILEYLADRFGFDAPFHRDSASRARQREVLAMVDVHLTPLVFTSGEPPDMARFEEFLDVLTRAILPGPAPLLTFVLGPVWLRLRWKGDSADFMRSIRARPLLEDWLDAMADQKSVTDTAPARAAVRREVLSARAAGRI